MKVYKFGGASVRNADGVRNLRRIIDDEQHLFIIVSAMGKTTNALEKVFEGLQKGDPQQSMEHIAQLREYHAQIIDDLWHEPKRIAEVDALFDELERVATQTVYRAEDAELWYDAIVAYGELVSTTIISACLSSAMIFGAYESPRESMARMQYSRMPLRICAFTLSSAMSVELLASRSLRNDQPEDDVDPERESSEQEQDHQGDAQFRDIESEIFGQSAADTGDDALVARAVEMSVVVSGHCCQDFLR